MISYYIFSINGFPSISFLLQQILSYEISPPLSVIFIIIYLCSKHPKWEKNWQKKPYHTLENLTINWSILISYAHWAWSRHINCGQHQFKQWLVAWWQLTIYVPKWLLFEKIQQHPPEENSLHKCSIFQWLIMYYCILLLWIFYIQDWILISWQPMNYFPISNMSHYTSFDKCADSQCP